MNRNMRAVEITSFGGPEVLRLGERPVPQPGVGELLIRVAASGINRPDVLQRLGLYPPPPDANPNLGLEVSGVVVGVGLGVADGMLGKPGACIHENPKALSRRVASWVRATAQCTA